MYKNKAEIYSLRHNIICVVYDTSAINWRNNESCKNTCHNHGHICEVDVNGDILDY